MIYQNSGNALIVSLVPQCAKRILDIGCGAGDNARLLTEARTDRSVVGWTRSVAEGELARVHCTDVIVADIDDGVPPELEGDFDALVFSHVLEHLVDPVAALRSLLRLLRPDGALIIAVPNVLEWRTRSRFLRGQFHYADSGILDRTHLHFYTYDSVVQELIAPLRGMRVERIEGRGSFPLGPLRHRLLSDWMKAAIDNLAVRRQPNLFAAEIAILARKIVSDES
jgi:SAM-dependent methyltransferase